MDNTFESFRFTLRDRTADLLRAKQALSPASWRPGQDPLKAIPFLEQVIQPQSSDTAYLLRLHLNHFHSTLGGWLQEGYLTDFGCYKLVVTAGRPEHIPTAALIRD